MLSDLTGKELTWEYGAVPLARNETHDKVVGMMEKEPRGKVLDVPTGTGVLAGRLRGMGFQISCCDINSSYFSIPDLPIDIGDLNQILPYPDHSFDYIICLDGIEHRGKRSRSGRLHSRSGPAEAPRRCDAHPTPATKA